MGFHSQTFLPRNYVWFFFHPVLGSFSVADFLDENLDPAVNSSPSTTGTIFLKSNLYHYMSFSFHFCFSFFCWFWPMKLWKCLFTFFKSLANGNHRKENHTIKATKNELTKICNKLGNNNATSWDIFMIRIWTQKVPG